MNQPVALIEPRHSRAAIEAVKPQVDGGRFPVKRTVGDKVVVEAEIFADGREQICAVVKYRRESDDAWSEAPMHLVSDDRWQGEFVVSEPGFYRYTVEAWLDVFKSWRHDFKSKFEAGMELGTDIKVGVGLVESVAQRAPERDATRLQAWANELAEADPELKSQSATLALDSGFAELADKYPDRRAVTTYHQELPLLVGPVRAQFSAWYEMFPRSCSAQPGRHGTFRDCEEQLPRIARMGFDVLYLPPIHPIGRIARRGKNNNPVCGPGDPGSPWGIGSREGGHKSVHPELGSIEDFRRLVTRAREQGIEVAVDIAFQCSPEHPYVSGHPDWFRRLPGGLIRYAENPPKKYEDIYPFDFESRDWPSLWQELKSIFDFWISQGIRIFRVDNPHTKAFAFWEWCISELRLQQPDLVLLAEAFTRPRVMYHLAKLGFNQSYNYFPWRNTKHELTNYFQELGRNSIRDFFRPNLWVNTPDILTDYLQTGGRPAFMTRLVLAATLGASYGIYGPAFELCENLPREPGSEEYLNSEKYEIRHWNLESPASLEHFITRLNRIRRENPALHSDARLAFHETDNDELLAYSKISSDGANIILVVVNLDPHHTHRGWLELPLPRFGLAPEQSYQLHDLLSDARFLRQGPRNFIELNPDYCPAHVFRLRRYVRSERDFDYYM